MVRASSRERATDTTAILKKLQYKGQGPVLVLRPPLEATALVTAISSAGVVVDREPRSSYPFILAFARSMAEAQEVAAACADALEGDGIVWFAYPKQTSRRYSADINRDTSWPVFEPYGLRPVSQVAIDDDWSALRFRRI